jgi:hypothetical protein
MVVARLKMEFLILKGAVEVNRKEHTAAKPQPKQEALTAEYAEYAENRILPGSPSAYSAYSAVCPFPEDSSQPANNFHYCSAKNTKTRGCGSIPWDFGSPAGR